MGARETEPTSDTPLRSTRQRRAVIGLLSATDEFRSAQEIHDAIRQGGDRVGLATVYRTLQSLVETGDVDLVKTDAGESVYRRCSAVHHHHLVCRTCGRTVEIEGPAVETWAEKLAKQHGYTEVSHTLELFGTCASCAAADAKRLARR